MADEDVPLASHFQRLTPSPGTAATPGILIVFINGLMLPQTNWTHTTDILKTSLAETNQPVSVACLTYDRYGQGASRPSPSLQPSWKPQLHDMLAAADELHTVISRTIASHWATTSSPKLLFVSHSIGVPLARIYCSQYPQTPVSGHLFLDSNIANTDFTSIFPDPDEPGFDPSELPQDSTVSDLKAIRERTKKMFHPSTPNPEGLDRSTLRKLLPYADKPKLLGPGGKGGPFLTVVGHDAEAFAEEGWKLNGTPKGLNLRYMQPFWEAYNERLLRLGDAELEEDGKERALSGKKTENKRRKGVVIAKGAGHFVQRDNPECVAEEVGELVQRILAEDW